MITLQPHGKSTNAPALIAIPGIDGSIGSIAPVVERLKKTRQIVVVDYSAETNPTLDDLSKQIAAAVRGQINSEVDVLGQSIGTILAAHVACRYDLPVRRVVLMATFTKLSWTRLRISTFMMRLTPRWLYRMTTRPLMAMVCGPVGDGRDHPFFAASRASDPKGVLKRTRWQIGRDFSADLRQLEGLPTRILMGMKDRFVPDAQKEVGKLQQLFASHPETVIPIAGAGHVFLPSTAIASAVEHLEEFLS